MTPGTLRTSRSGRGVWVGANDEINTARDVGKTSSFNIEAFHWPYGLLDYIVEGQPRHYHAVARNHAVSTAWCWPDA
ncbi:hypothetical protein [Bordetella sp. FB-8]|uniref:hypothetical protein n=1 Tax=Bordetella sp. FB-8 TaxID=1159870 RepID=UPI0003794F52|nr:hypothetical protein [Bordetella sp. FB-8]